MIADQAQQQSNYTGTKYYQFYTVATILEHVIDCFHTIVSDETNPYHPPLSWLTRKNPKPPQEQLFLDLHAECSEVKQTGGIFSEPNSDRQLSLKLKSELEKLSKESRRNIVMRKKDGCSPLFKAAQSGHHSIVRYLLDFCGADIEQRGCYETLEDHHVHSVSPLWIAAISGRLDIVKLLMEKGAKINSVSDTGSTSLRSVCFLCKDDDEDSDQLDEFIVQDSTLESDIYFQIVKLLIRNGADVQKSNYNGGTCLMNSVHNYKLTKYLLENGADVNATDLQSKTALHYAIQQGRLPVTKLLLSYNADPMLLSNNSDDALRLSCLCGHLDILEHLVSSFEYPRHRLIDAYKLLGSSILELRYDLSKVRELWQTAVNLTEEEGQERENLRDKSTSNSTTQNVSQRIELCDIRRSLAFGDRKEFQNQSELDDMPADEFRAQSLLISERILGPHNHELVQRLMYRGNFYLGSLRPDKCINLWIYALILRLKQESIFHFESVFTAQALTKLFLDLIGQNQQLHPHPNTRWYDVYDVLRILVDQLDGCRAHLNMRPTSCLHEDIFDLLLGIIVKLLLALNYCLATLKRSDGEEFFKTKKLIRLLVKLDPRTSEGNSLLHGCVMPAVLEIDAVHRQLLICSHGEAQVSSFPSPVGRLIDSLVNSGLDVDTSNKAGLSTLQVLCLQTGIRVEIKRQLIALLINHNAHIDRRVLTSEQGIMIRQTLRDAGFEPNQSMRLTCLAAKSLAESKIKVDNRALCKSLGNLVATH